MFIELKWYDKVLLLLHTDDEREKTLRPDRKASQIRLAQLSSMTTRTSRTFTHIHAREKKNKKHTDDEREKKTRPDGKASQIKLRKWRERK